MNIGIVQSELVYPRGAERQVCELAHYLHKRGNKVTIYTFNTTPNYQFNYLLKNIRIISLRKNYFPIFEANDNFFYNLLHFLSIQIKNLIYTIQLSKLLNKHDILNAHNYPSHWISMFTDIPTIWTCNEPPYWNYYKLNIFLTIAFLPSRIMDWVLSIKLKAIFCLDDRMMSIIRENYRIPILKLGSGASLPRIYRKNKNDSIFNILFIGELHEQKRPIDLLKAVSKLKLMKNDIVIHLVGGGVQKELLQNYAHDQNLNVIFYGRAANSVVLHLYSIADLSVFVPENQPWGIFPLESIIAKIPTIISDECGVAEILMKYDVPIVKTGDIDELKRNIIMIRKNYKFYEDKFSRLSKRIKMTYGWDTYTDRFINKVKVFID